MPYFFNSKNLKIIIYNLTILYKKYRLINRKGVIDNEFKRSSKAS